MNPPSGAGDGNPGHEALLITAARAVANSSELESLSRPFLTLLHEMTDLEAFYVTEVSLARGEQRALFGDTRTDLPDLEGRASDWQDSLCKRALEAGTAWTSDVATDLPGSLGAERIGFRTYATVAIRTSEDELLGTLCGVSRHPVEVSQRVVDVMTMLARLIGEAWERERRQTAATHRADAVESQLRERAGFLAEVEYQLKPALVQILGWSDLLASRWASMTPERRDGTLAALQTSSREALGQLETLLAESQREVLADELQPRPLSPLEVVNEIVEELASTTTRHTVIGPEHRVGITVLADRRALRQILWHLAENAVEYSPAGGRIRFRIDSPPGRVVIVVEDEGIGVPTDVDIFAPYVRGPGQDDKRAGLGLHLARNLARNLGGTVTAEPRIPNGSTFRVELPLLT